MDLNIKTYTQGSDTSADRELFGLVGNCLVDKDVHEKLGMAITAAGGDLWWVAMGATGAATGFATARKMKDGGLHMRFVYQADDNVGGAHALVRTVLAHAKEGRCTCVWTNDRADMNVWKALGFTFTPRVRGAFGRWEKSLKGKA